MALDKTCPPAVSPIANKGIWIFVGIDLAIFALFFMVYLIERKASLDLFQLSQARLEPAFGFINTMLLLTSSWLLVRSLRILDKSVRQARWYLGSTIFLGLMFVVSKVVEYRDKYEHGIGVAENTFFTFYYVLTFIHLAHVLAGLIGLAIVYSWLQKSQPFRSQGFYGSLGIYWHMVDLLWIYLFLLLYLMR